MQENLFTCTTLTFSSTFKTMDPSEYEIILSYLMTDSYPHGFTKDQKRNLRKRASKYLAINDKLVKLSEGKQLLVIKLMIFPVFWEKSTIMLDTDVHVTHIISRKTGIFGLWIRSYVDNCIRCQKNQPTLKATSIQLQPLPVITKVWFRVGIDLSIPKGTSIY